MTYPKLKKDAFNLMGFGIGVSVAQSISPSVNLSPLTSKMPVMANIMASGMVLEEVNKLNKKVKKIY